MDRLRPADLDVLGRWKYDDPKYGRRARRLPKAQRHLAVQLPSDKKAPSPADQFKKYLPAGVVTVGPPLARTPPPSMTSNNKLVPVSSPVVAVSTPPSARAALPLRSGMGVFELEAMRRKKLSQITDTDERSFYMHRRIFGPSATIDVGSRRTKQSQNEFSASDAWNRFPDFHPDNTEWCEQMDKRRKRGMLTDFLNEAIRKHVNLAATNHE